MSNAFIIGKFMPLTKGHELLISFAANYCRRLGMTLTVLVGTQPSEKIPGHLRREWVKNFANQFGNIRVTHMDQEMPQTPEEHPDFWNLWLGAIGAFTGRTKYDLVFSSEDYGWKLAEVLGAIHIPVNINRDTVAISATKVREAPLGPAYDYISEWARPYFNQKIVIAGPESCGKTTLTKNFASWYETTWMPEFARIYYDNLKTVDYECKYEDIELICRGHMAMEESMLPMANRILFVDTDPVITELYSEIYFNKVPDFVKLQAMDYQCSHTLVLAPTVPYVEDTLRDLPHMREEFLKRYVEKLDYYGRTYDIIDSNSWVERNRHACEVVNRIIAPLKGVLAD